MNVAQPQETCLAAALRHAQSPPVREVPHTVCSGLLSTVLPLGAGR